MFLNISNNIELIYKKENSYEVKLIKNNYKIILEMINKLWGLKNKRIKVYIMKSSLKFMFTVLPFYKKVLLCLVFPFWYIQVKKN
mgnify:CR=1 FL=1